MDTSMKHLATASTVLVALALGGCVVASAPAEPERVVVKPAPAPAVVVQPPSGAVVTVP